MREGEFRPVTGRNAKRGRPPEPLSVRGLARERYTVPGCGWSRSNVSRLHLWAEMHERFPFMAERKWRVGSTLRVRAALLRFPESRRAFAVALLKRLAEEEPTLTPVDLERWLLERLD